MARPTLPADGIKPWGTILRNAIFDISDRTDNAIAAATNANTTATSALTTANTAAGVSTSNSNAIASLQQALAAKSNDNAVVHLSGDETIAGVKTFTAAPAVPDNAFAISKVNGLQTALNNAGTGTGGTGGISTTDPRLSDTRIPTDGSVTNVKVAANAGISADKIADGTTNKAFTTVNQTKLNGIATGATANATDAALRDRTTHTGITPVAGIGSGTPSAGRYVDGGTGAWTVLPAGGTGTSDPVLAGITTLLGNADVDLMVRVPNTLTARPTIPSALLGKVQILIVGGTTPPSWMQATDIQLAVG